MTERRQLKPEDRENLVVYVTQVQPHPSNPNNGNQDRIEASLAAHGVFRSIVVQKSTNYILAGNTTWAAACESGMREIPIERIDVDDEQAHEIMVADNHLASLAEMDKGLLARLVRDAPTNELPAFGFDQEELARLLASVDKDPKPLTRRFVLEFESDEQMEAWQAFLKILKRRYSDEPSTGGRVAKFAREEVDGNEEGA